MTMRRRGLLIAAMSLVSLGFGTIASSAAEFEWKFYTFFNANDMPARMQKDFAADVTKATGGRLNISVYAGGELPYGFTDTLRAVSTNQVQMGDMGLSVVSGELPGLQVTDLPLLCNTYDRFYAAMKDLAPIIDSRLREKFGVTTLISWTMPPQQLWFRAPLNNIDGLKGRKIRSYSRVHQQLLSAFGATGVSITGAEVTGALDRGVVDGAITAAIPANDWKFPEVAKYGYVVDLHMTTSQLIVNQQMLNALPEDIRKILLAKAAEWAPKFRERVTEAEQEAYKKLAEKGEVLVKPSAEDMAKLAKVADTLWSSWAAGNPDQVKMVEIAKASCSR